MNKIWLLLWVVFAISCKTKEQKTVDKYYNNFKTEIAKDSLSIFAKSDAQFVADFHYDHSKQEEAKEWLTKVDNYMKTVNDEIKNKKAGEMLFLARNLRLLKTLYKEEHCNFLQQHILVGTYTDDKDTLTKAVKILTDSIWSTISFSNDCVKNIRCGVYLYKNNKNFELNGWREWFVMGTKITGQEVSVGF